MKWLPWSLVESSLWRVTARPRQLLAPPPALVTTAVYCPLERKWALGYSVCGERKRRGETVTAGGSARVDSAGGGRVIGTQPGTRSCCSGPVGLTPGSGGETRAIGPPEPAVSHATQALPL